MQPSHRFNKKPCGTGRNKAGRDKAGHRVTSPGLRARRGVKSHSQELSPKPPAPIHTIQPRNSFLRRRSSESRFRLTFPRGKSSFSGAAGDSAQPPFGPGAAQSGAATRHRDPAAQGASHCLATRSAHHVCARGCRGSTEVSEQALTRPRRLSSSDFLS